MYLNCHTYYSMRFGTFSEIDLLELATQRQISQLALTDINNTSACLNFVRKAQQYGIKPILGIDFRNGVDACFVGIAKNNAGYQELNQFLSLHLQTTTPFSTRAPEFKNVYVIYPFEKVQLHDLKEFSDNEYIGVSIAALRKLPFSSYIKLKDKLVVLQPVTFRNKRDFNAHRLLRAIDNNTLLSKLPKSEQTSANEFMFPLTNLAQAFAEYSFILENTQRLMDSCSIDFDFSASRKPQNLQAYSGSKKEDFLLLKKLCHEGLPYRYPKADKAITNRLKKELDLIEKMDFVSYFLINWDIISYARKQGYFYVGRGSGANSIVAYLLRITDVDPVELDLYFERFINLYRSNPPDFDIDFSWKDRQDVTRYIFNRFKNVALLGSYVTFQYRGVVRELGKVFGLPKAEIDLLASGNVSISSLDDVASLVIKYGKLIEGFPNYISIHAGGILITEKPIHYFSATNFPPKGFPTTQFDMVIAEDIGLYKFDILGQRGLAKIKDAMEIIAYNRPDAEPYDIHEIKKFKEDPVINNTIKTAQCMGCFYIESPAMRMLLKKLEVDNYLGLVAASSIIRPGVAKSGMMREYIVRHRDRSKIKNAHPAMLEIMPETYGIMVYQEDVIKVAHHFAGLSLGEADVLRRGMSGKFRSRAEFQKVKEKFIANCREKEYSEELINAVWNQIASFAGYAFAKGHSASYAVESYQTLFLKTYFPLEYIVAVLNNGGGFYRPEFYIHEAEMLGATIERPCINESIGANSIQDTAIYLGFAYLKDLEDRVIERILKNRVESGAFKSLDDFLDRVVISAEQISILIRINAFRFTGVGKYELLWQAYSRLAIQNKKQQKYPQLFTSPPRRFKIPKLKATMLEAAFDEIELLGFPLCSPFELLKEPPRNHTGVKDFDRYLNKYIDIYGYLVTVKNAATHTGKRMHFATLADRYGVVFDTVLFPQVAKKYFFRGRGIYRFYGKVVEEFGFLSIEVLKMRKEAYIQDPRYADGRMSKMKDVLNSFKKNNE